MRKLACLFFPEEGVVKGMDVRAEDIGALEAGVGLAVPAADAWVHVNAGLPCQDGSKAANHRPAEAGATARARRDLLHLHSALGSEVPQGGLVR